MEITNGGGKKPVGKTSTISSRDLENIMDKVDGSPNGIVGAAEAIVNRVKDSILPGAGLNHPVLEAASDCLTVIAERGYDVGYIRSLLQGLANHFDPNFVDRVPTIRTRNGPTIYEGF